MNDDKYVVTTMQKNDTTEIKFALSTFKGKQRADIREFVDSDTYTGPTKAGMNIPLEQWDEFYDSIQELNIAAQEALKKAQVKPVEG